MRDGGEIITLTFTKLQLEDPEWAVLGDLCDGPLEIIHAGLTVHLPTIWAKVGIGFTFSRSLSNFCPILSRTDVQFAIMATRRLGQRCRHRTRHRFLVVCKENNSTFRFAKGWAFQVLCEGDKDGLSLWFLVALKTTNLTHLSSFLWLALFYEFCWMTSH